VDQDIATIRVQHVRVHGDYLLEVSPDVTVITGANGSGKTSLIEALYIAMRGSSFKGSDSDVLSRGETWYRIDVTLRDGTVRTVKFDSSRRTGRKQFIVDGKTYYRLPPAHRYPIILFEPDDLRLLNGSPTRRRQFIDTFISQFDPQYALHLRRYERALKQRNALLKQQSSRDELFVWDMALSEHGAYLIEQRLAVIAELDKGLQPTYNDIARASDVVGITYSRPADTSFRQKLLRELHARSAYDMSSGFTSVGPHRDDLIFSFNGSPALSVASRGEIRSVVLALKFLEVEIVSQRTNRDPIILLDDVFSELDENRQKKLVKNFSNYQILVTTATAPEGMSVIKLG
jgi:DNA replication and repair protein RecF